MRKGLSLAAAIVAAATLQGCTALPTVLAVAGKALPVLHLGAAVVVDIICSEVVGADGRDAIRSHVYGDRSRSLIRREGC